MWQTRIYTKVFVYTTAVELYFYPIEFNSGINKIVDILNIKGLGQNKTKSLLSVLFSLTFYIRLQSKAISGSSPSL